MQMDFICPLENFDIYLHILALLCYCFYQSRQYIWQHPWSDGYTKSSKHLCKNT